MRALGFAVAKEEVRAIMLERAERGPDAAEGDGKAGRLGFEAFADVMAEKYLQRSPEDEIRKAFALFDEDGTGKVSVKNVKRIAKELGEALTDDEIAAMVREFDSDGDGAIDAEEFMAIMAQSSLY
jgi:Ca2+-binding EF-hand superfamily protein